MFFQCRANASLFPSPVSLRAEFIGSLNPIASYFVVLDISSVFFIRSGEVFFHVPPRDLKVYALGLASVTEAEKHVMSHRFTNPIFWRNMFAFVSQKSAVSSYVSPSLLHP